MPWERREKDLTIFSGIPWGTWKKHVSTTTTTTMVPALLPGKQKLSQFFFGSFSHQPMGKLEFLLPCHPE